MIKKTSILEALKGFPDEFEVETLIERILLIQKIELGLAQAEKGETVSNEEAKQSLKRWLK